MFAASQKTDDISVSLEMEEKLLTYPDSNRALKHSTTCMLSQQMKSGGKGRGGEKKKTHFRES